MYYVELNKMDSFEFYLIILPGVVIDHCTMILKLDEYTAVVIDFLKGCAE